MTVDSEMQRSVGEDEKMKTKTKRNIDGASLEGEKARILE